MRIILKFACGSDAAFSADGGANRREETDTEKRTPGNEPGETEITSADQRRERHGMTYQTEQKEALIGYLAAHAAQQFTAGELARELTRTAPIGASTVYRLLGVLTDEGHIRRFTLGRGKTFYYQYVGGERCGTHLHLKCIVCGRLFHLAGCVSDFMQKQILATSRFALDESQTILFGTCAACRGES